MAQQYEPGILFLSYARANRETALRFKSDLQARGMRVWIDDEGIPAGTPDWEKTIREAISFAGAVILLASPDAQESLYVRDEIRIAQDLYQRTVYPVWIEGESWMTCVPLGLGSTQYIDARQSNYPEAISALAAIFHRDSRSRSTPLEADIAEEPRNPYKGLQAFTEAEAQDFFGRIALINLLAARLRQALSADKQDIPRGRLLAIVGPSGSGKSSVVMAGLLPSLRRGDVLDSRAWMYLEPITPGEDPLGNLQATLAKELPHGNPSVIRNDLEGEDAQGLCLYARMLTQSRRTNVALIIDQFEELFTLTITEHERRQFINLLTNALTEPQGPLIVILTLRADSYDRPMHYPEFARLLSAYQQIVFPMTLTELRTAIEAPAQKVGLTFEKDLVSDLLFEMVGQSNALPLLQFTLEQLFQHRNGRQLTCQAYQELGGIGGALRNQAEKTYNALPSKEQRRQAQSLFLRLISPGVREQNATRRRVALTEISFPDAEQTRMMLGVANTFVTARLLTMSEVAGIRTIEVSHEAIIREWKRLSDWLSSSHSDILLQHSISKDAAEWIYSRKPADRLYRGTQLKKARAWARHNIPSTNETAFLEASHVSRIQFLVSIFALCVLLLTTTSLTGWFFLQRPPDPRYVTTLNDDGVGSLRWAITNAPAKSTITFDRSLKGTIILKNDDLDITKSVSIKGSDTHLVSISGGHQNLKVHIFQRISVTISDLVFRDGMLTRYSMIYNEGTLKLINCIVSGNTALADAIDDTQWTGNGGGIYNAGTLTLTSTTVSHNEAKKSGGGIYNTGILTLNKSTLSWNKVTGSGYGGGISTIGTLTLNSSTISENTVPQGGGGGIFNGCVDNTIPSIEARCKDGNQIATLTLKNNSAISNNVSVYGGGIFNTGKFTMISSQVSGNRTANEGSGIDNSSPFNVRFTNSTISGNSSGGKNTFGGGGIFNDGSDYDYSKTSTLELVNCTVSENTAANAGGIFSQFSELTLIDTTISENTTLPVNTHDKDRSHNGGGLVNLFSATILINSTISGNRASQDGGGIYNQGGLIVIAFCTLINNTANKGGALDTVDDSINDTGHILHGRVFIKGTILVSNKADTYPNSYGQLTSGGYNLIQDISTVNISENRLPGTDISVNSQDLATIFSAHAQLQDNGGPSKTYALLTNKSNPAIDKVPLVSCHLTISKIDIAITTDQRGKPRPDRKEAMCDIGAYESQD